MFQGSEKDKFPISEYLSSADKDSRDVQWRASNTDKQPMPVRIGDRAFIWRTEGGKPGSGGLVAVGHVTREPRQEAAEARELYLDLNHADAVDDSVWRVRIRLEKPRLTPSEGMLLRRALKADNELKDLCILLKWRGVTICGVEPRHERALLEEWDAKGANLTP